MRDQFKILAFRAAVHRYWNTKLQYFELSWLVPVSALKYYKLPTSVQQSRFSTRAEFSGSLYSESYSFYGSPPQAFSSRSDGGTILGFKFIAAFS